MEFTSDIDIAAESVDVLDTLPGWPSIVYAWILLGTLALVWRVHKQDGAVDPVGEPQRAQPYMLGVSRARAVSLASMGALAWLSFQGIFFDGQKTADVFLLMSSFAFAAMAVAVLFTPLAISLIGGRRIAEPLVWGDTGRYLLVIANVGVACLAVDTFLA